MPPKSLRLSLSLLALFAVTFAPPLRALVPDPGPVTPAVPTAAEAPVALLVDLGSGQVLHARNPDARFMPASVTKVMTLYLAFELIAAGRLDPSQVFMMSPVIASEWRRKGSTMFLDRGERVRVDDLLLGIANVSANDGAAVLAEGQAGSVAAWTTQMNQTALGLGMTGSYFASPNGWPDEGRTFTTANDLARLARALIMRHPDKFGYYIGRAGFDMQAICQAANSLIMDRVYVQCAFGISARQYAAIGKIHGMAVVKHRIEGNIIGRMVTDQRIARARVAT